MAIQYYAMSELSGLTTSNLAGGVQLFMVGPAAEKPSSGLRIGWRYMESDGQFKLYKATDATTWAEIGGGGGSGLTNDSLMLPPFFNHANLTAVTAFVTNTSYFVYLGRVSSAITTLDLRSRVTAGAATITWAEVGVFTGSPVLAGNPSLTRRGYTNVALTFNSTGLKSTTISLSGVSANDELWLAFGSQATTPFQLRGGLADDIQAGWYASVAGRISTLSTPVTVTLASGTLVPPWCAAKL